MPFSDLISAVQNIIQDDFFTEEMIGTYLNQAQLEVAGGMQSALGDWITPPLPGLLTIGTVTTVLATPYLSMPTDFQRNLQLVASSEGYELILAESFNSFTSTYPNLDRIGTISECIEFGNLLYYQGIPTVATDLTIHYYRLPVEMEDDEDEPDGIPIQLQRSLLLNHACWRIFELIEDGIEGVGVNTQRYMNSFYLALKNLELTIPYENKIVNLLSD